MSFEVKTNPSSWISNLRNADIEENVITQDMNRDILNPSEDSDFSSNYTVYNNANLNQIKEQQSTIGEGIKFVDPLLIEREKPLKLGKVTEEKKRKAIEKKVAAEKYKKEIEEAQYTRLLHLLTQSKAMSNYILKKSNNSKAIWQKKQTNVELSVQQTVSSKRTRKQTKKYGAAEKSDIENKSKRSRSLNLSEEKIKEELKFMSDDEENSVNIMNTKVSENFGQSKYFQGELRDYQKVGVNWLRVLYENCLNGILADEMGLGKTIQIIALFAYLMEKNIAGPYLIIVPLSTLPNWVSEFERFAPKLPVLVFYGSKPERSQLKKKIQQKVRLGTLSTQPIVITTYEVPIFEKRFMVKFHWRYVVVDEAQRIKNYNSLLSRTLKLYNSYNRLLLTGTPLQNDLSELWALLNFLLPDIFNSLSLFELWFDAKKVQNEEGKEKFLKQEQERQVIGKLREILKPFMLRRLKEDVCLDIPPLKEVIVYTPLTEIQYDLYLSILNKDLFKFTKRKEEPLILDIDGIRPKRKCTLKRTLDDLMRNYTGVNNKIKKLNEWGECTKVTEENIEYLVSMQYHNDGMTYRHIVNHPYIVYYPLNDDGSYKINEDLVKASGKMLVLDAILKRLKKKGHKVLFFSGFKKVLDLMEHFILLRDYQYVRLDGQIQFDERKEAIDAFQANPEIFLFLLTTKAGAVGLNLAAADTVIIYDSDWNPQNDLQAMARCHRIGQTKPVAVYRLCTKGSVDEVIIKRANMKRFLEKAVISKEGNFIDSPDDIIKLRKLLETDGIKIVNAKTEVYTEFELDALLDRSDMV